MKYEFTDQDLVVGIQFCIFSWTQNQDYSDSFIDKLINVLQDNVYGGKIDNDFD